MKPSTLLRLASRVLGVLAGCLLLATAWAPAASAGSCSGNLSGLIGTPCVDGSLQFTFTSLSGESYVYNYATDTYISGPTTWTASDFSVSPVSNGFSLSLNAGSQSLTPASDVEAYDEAYFYYTVSDLHGSITGENVTSAGLSSSAGDGEGIAYIYGFTYNPTYTGYTTAYTEIVDGTVYSEGSYLSGSPFSNSPDAQGYGIYLYADNGGTAYWDGTTTFTYDTTSTTTPEPASLLLFGTALLGIAFITRRKLAH